MPLFVKTSLARAGSEKMITKISTLIVQEGFSVNSPISGQFGRGLSVYHDSNMLSTLDRLIAFRLAIKISEEPILLQFPASDPVPGLCLE